MDTTMFIPKTIKVGYQTRKDTYTGRLAYVIYTDDKGKLRKEKSWQSWRSNKISPDDFDNEPTSGFVLNKKVGGVHDSWSSRNIRIEKVRVYDPRNFEFEISIPNLLFILQETSAIKGKGLEGEFVYAWDGTELVLLPVDCEEYRECVKHTKRQSIKFDGKELKEGFSYLMKDGSEAMYLGHHNFNNKTWRNEFNPVGKRHVFLPSEKRESWEDPYIALSGFTKIAECSSSSALPNFANQYEKFKKSVYSGDISKVKLTKIKFSEGLEGKTIVVKDGEQYFTANVARDWGMYRYPHERPTYQYKVSSKPFVPEIQNNTLKLPKIPKSGTQCSSQKLAAMEFFTLTVVTEKGRNIKVA